MLAGRGVPLTEFMIEHILRDGLKRIRANPAILDDVFSGFMDPFLVDTYGPDTMTNLKTYILGTEFHITQSWPNESTKLPCCSINILSSDEQPNKAMFSDVASYTRSVVTPQVIIDLFQPLNYNSVAGYITVPNTIDLSDVLINQIFVDCSDNEFIITSVLNDSTTKRLGIGVGETVDISTADCFVKGLVSQEITEIRQIPLQEKIVLGIHAKDEPKACKYFYMIILYILASSRDVFEANSMQIHNTNISDFSRVLEYLPAEWFSRFINLTFLTWMDWRAGTLFTPESSSISIKVDKDTVVTPVSSNKSIITTI